MLVAAVAICSAAVAAFAATASSGSGNSAIEDTVQTDCIPALKTDTIDTPDPVGTIDQLEKAESEIIGNSSETGDIPDSNLKKNDTNFDSNGKKEDTSTEKVTSKTSDSDVKNNTSQNSDSDKKDSDSKNTDSKDSDRDSKDSDTKSKNGIETSSGSDNNSSQKEDESSDIGTDSKNSKNNGSSDSVSKNEKNSDTDKVESKSKTKYPPKQYLIDVKHYTQLGVLPTGCEIISAKMVLNYYGKKNITEDELIANLPRDNLKVSKDGKLYGKTPFQAFIGAPKQKSGFGCYPPVIMQMVENYDYPDLYTEDTSGLPLDFVAKTYVTQDIPVLVWVTIGMGQSYLTGTWNVEDSDGNITKEKYTWRAAEHCMVLIGYDEKSYYFCDPLSEKNVVKFDKSIVEKRYREVGSYSMLIRQYEED